jgi:hypothetical protein
MHRIKLAKLQRRQLVIVGDGEDLFYCGLHREDKLGSLQKKIILMLVKEPLHGAEIARRLGTWHNAVHVALRKLEEKGLVESYPSPGTNLQGTRIWRRFYALSPRCCFRIVPVKRPTKAKLEAASRQAQTLGIQRQIDGIMIDRMQTGNVRTMSRKGIKLRPNRRRVPATYFLGDPLPAEYRDSAEAEQGREGATEAQSCSYG